MKAIVQDRNGSADVLELRDIEEPHVGGDDVLVRVSAASAHIGDWHLMTGLPYVIPARLRAPRAQDSCAGEDLAGRVEAVGKNVTLVARDDEVFGTGAGSFPDVLRVVRLHRGRPERRRIGWSVNAALARRTVALGLRTG